jgi:hypothetical protein
MTAPVERQLQRKELDRRGVPVLYEKLQDRIQAAPTPELAGAPATAGGGAPGQAKTKASHCRPGRLVGRHLDASRGRFGARSAEHMLDLRGIPAGH